MGGEKSDRCILCLRDVKSEKIKAKPLNVAAFLVFGCCINAEKKSEVNKMFSRWKLVVCALKAVIHCKVRG